MKILCLLCPLIYSVVSQIDMYDAKPWVPKNISPGVAEFIQMPAPKLPQHRPARNYPGPPAPVYRPQHRQPTYMRSQGYIRRLQDQQTSESIRKPVRVIPPPVTFRNSQTQLTPPRPNLPPPIAKMYRGAMARNDVVPIERDDDTVNEVEDEEDVSTLVNFGDWAAQWDEIEEGWYFYNYITGESTWEKPDDLKDLRFENPFSSADETDSAQIPSPLTVDGDDYQTTMTNSLLAPGDNPPLLFEQTNNGYGYENIIDTGDGYTKDEIDKAAVGGDDGILSFLGLNNLKKKLNIDNILGLKLQEGGSIKKAMSKNLSELSLYKNVAKDFVETFLIKVTGWAVISAFIYGKNILSAKRKRRSTTESNLTSSNYLSEIQTQIERSIATDFTKLIDNMKV